MEGIMGNWFILTVIVPVIIAVFKTEITNLITAYNVYRLRAFDSDGNPYTSDSVLLLNEATGEWQEATIKKYVFALSARQRGVYLEYPSGIKEKVSLLKWATFRKAARA